MSARRKGKRAPNGVRPDWWQWPTFMTYNAAHWTNSRQTIRVELILPDGNKVDLGHFPNTENHDELRLAVGLRFKEIWDPEKRCRRREPT